MQKGKVNVLIDGMWGSTGKGKLAGILALKHPVGLAVNNFMTNAGHTWISDDPADAPVMVQQLPSCLVNRHTALHIAATAVIDPETFDAELSRFEKYGLLHRLTVDPNAAVIKRKDKDAEMELHRISSTAKGCGAALAEKIMRRAGLVKAEADHNEEWHGVPVVKTRHVVHGHLLRGRSVLFETAQGHDLSLNHGVEYPFTTSRDITTCQALSDACVPPSKAGDVYASLRCFPIRVGNAFDRTGGTVDNRNGWSGPCYPDQHELSWDDITKISGSPTPLLERTTVTNKVRRIFTFSQMQLEKFISVNGPTFLFLNFANYINHKVYGLSVRGPAQLADFKRTFPDIMRFVEQVEKHGVPVAYLGTGPAHSHVVDMGVDVATT